MKHGLYEYVLSLRLLLWKSQLPDSFWPAMSEAEALATALEGPSGQLARAALANIRSDLGRGDVDSARREIHFLHNLPIGQKSLNLRWTFGAHWDSYREGCRFPDRVMLADHWMNELHRELFGDQDS